MRRTLAMLLVWLMLALTACGGAGETVGSEEDKRPSDSTAQVTQTEVPPSTETEGEPLPKESETEAPETEVPVPSQPTDETVRVILVDDNKDGTDEFKIVVDMEAAKSTEAVPFRIADIDNPSEDSFRTVSMYDLRGGEPKLVWYTNLCMGSAPRGGVALKNGGVIGWYYDVYENDDGVRISISCYEYGTVNVYGDISYRPLLKTGSVVTNAMTAEQFETYGLRNVHTLQNAVCVIDEMLHDAEILLDVTGTEPIFSTDENRFTKFYEDDFDYRNLEESLAPENQDRYIVPIK